MPPRPAVHLPSRRLPSLALAGLFAALPPVGPGLMDLEVHWTGPRDLRALVEAGSVRPLSLAAGDFDEDGVEDIVAGFASGRTGAVALFLGDGAARVAGSTGAPATGAGGAGHRAPFLRDARLFSAPLIPDFLRAGDFDADGHHDLVLGAAGGRRLALLRGDGRGGFEPAGDMQLPGALVHLASGDVNRRDGLPEILAVLQARGEARLTVYESPTGAFGSDPESMALAAPATDVLIADLDGDPWVDIAAAAGRTLILVHGRDRRLSDTPDARIRVEPASVERLAQETEIAGLQWGDFDADGARELAVLGADHLTLLPLAPGPTNGRSLSRDTPGQGTLLRARIASDGTEALILHDRARRRLTSLRADARSDGSRRGPGLDLDVRAVAILPMRLNADGLDDLVVLRDDALEPAVLPSAFSATFTVTSSASSGDGVCDATCTLRDAILAANASPGGDLIAFNIPPSGCKTIALSSALPAVSDTVTIDASTQPGYSGSSCIQLDGTPVPFPGINGLSLTINASGSVVRGLGLTHFGSVAMTLRGTGVLVENITVAQNRFMGIDLGTTDGVFRNSVINGMNDGAGRALLVGGSGNQVLGCTISNNVNEGVILGGSGHTFGGLTGQGNLIASHGGMSFSVGATGTLIQGNRVRNNGSGGLSVSGTGNTLGGTAPGAGNSIWANASPNVSLGGSQHVVQGNNLGADDTGTCQGPQPVFIGGSDMTLGGLTSGSGNLICQTQGFNDGVEISPVAGGSRVLGNRIRNNRTGVMVQTGSGHTIQANQFQGNLQAAIDLAPIGPTLNDAGDPDAGPNDLQNYPDLQAATCAGGITGLLDSTPGASFTLEFYSGAACHASGFGEGETSLGLMNVATDASGQAPFAAVPAGLLLPGRVITATATNAAGSTSEFSRCVTVQGASPAVVDDSVQVSHDSGTGISTLTWAPAPDAMTGNTYRGTIPIHYMGSQAPAYNHTCFEAGDAAGDGAAVTTDPTSPPSNEAFYYLVAARNACGAGSLGTSSTGAPRPVPAACP